MSKASAAEKEFQNTIVQTLDLFGYEGTHVFPLLDRYGRWRTPTTSPGWPDLVYLREPRLLAIEVKTDTGRLEAPQRAWLTLFSSLTCARAWLVRPSDPPWDQLVEWIRRPGPAPQIYGFSPVDDPVQVLAEHRTRKRKQTR